MQSEEWRSLTLKLVAELKFYMVKDSFPSRLKEDSFVLPYMTGSKYWSEVLVLTDTDYTYRELVPILAHGVQQCGH